MEKLNEFDILPLDQQDLIRDAEDIVKQVLARMVQTSKKYSSAYTLADIKNELDAELLDIVGWPLLEVVRLRRVMTQRLEQLDGEYLEKFLNYHDTDYLIKLRDAIDNKLLARANGK